MQLRFLGGGPIRLGLLRSAPIHPSESERALEPLEAHVCGRVDNNQLPVSAFYWRHQIGFPWKSALPERASHRLSQ